MLVSSQKTYFEELVNVVTDVIVGEFGIERLKVVIVHILGNERRSPRLASVSLGETTGKKRRIYHGVAHDIQEFDNVGPAIQVLKDLDFTLDFLLLDRLEYFDHALFVCHDVDALKHLRVLATTDFADNLVIVLRAISK